MKMSMHCHLRDLLLAVVPVAVLVHSLDGQSRCAMQSVGEHDLHYCVHGAGSPTIVLAAGTAQTSQSFGGLIRDLAALGTVVTFDRAGMGRSEPGPGPRSPTANAQDLRRLLHAVAPPGPLILVGHSAGGWQMLRLASMIPGLVAAVVLVDTPPVNFESERLQLLSLDEQATRLEMLADAEARAPAVIAAERAAAPGDLARGFDDFPRGIRLVVLMADQQEFGAGDKNEAHRQLWIERSRLWLGLADSTELVVVPGSGHMIHLDAPDAVRAVIEQLVQRARR